MSENDIFDNQLILGDNLLALKALEQSFTGRIKCVYIDPPYNTGSAFEHYDDGLEHSLWLSLLRDRLELLRNLMAEEEAHPVVPGSSTYRGGGRNLKRGWVSSFRVP
jgi:adenine-specific DNA-methyltransferase